MSEQMIPITLMSGQGAISMVCEKITIDWPKNPPKQNMMMVVVDRKTLAVVASECVDNKDLLTVPASIKKYDGNTEYMLLVATFALNNYVMIGGEMLAFLDKNGAGPELAKLIQCSSVIMSSYGYYSYCLASTMGTETGYENYKITYGSEGSNAIFLPLKLQKVGDNYILVNVFPK